MNGVYRYENSLYACPEGWHLPSDDEWMQLEMKVGMNSNKGHKEGWRGTYPGQDQKLLEHGDSGLDLQNCGYGLKARLSSSLIISYHGKQAFYWTSTEYSYAGGSGYSRHFTGRKSIERKGDFKKSFFPIRCVKD